MNQKQNFYEVFAWRSDAGVTAVLHYYSGRGSIIGTSPASVDNAIELRTFSVSQKMDRKNLSIASLGTGSALEMLK